MNMHSTNIKPSRKAPNGIDAHVGGRIRLRRMTLNMAQEKLGDTLGVSFQQIQKYEKGTNRVGASRLQAIAQALDVPVSYFFDGAPGADGKGGTDVFAGLSREAQALAVLFDSLNTAARAAVLATARSLSSVQAQVPTEA